VGTRPAVPACNLVRAASGGAGAFAPVGLYPGQTP